MEYVEISGTELRASRIGLGTWAIGGSMWGGTDKVDAIRSIHAALDASINLIDTAPVYGFGRSEAIVGRALAETGRRPRVIFATKVGLEWTSSQEICRNSSPGCIRAEIDHSLRRLRTDVIDLCRPEQLDTVKNFFGWNTDKNIRRDIETILGEEIGEAISPDSMAPPQ